MNGDETFLANPDFIYREVAGEVILVPVGKTAEHFSGLASPNKTGAFLWELLGKKRTYRELCKALAEEYELTGEMSRDSTTGVTGVNMYRGKYRALIHFQGKTYNLGTYRTLEEASAVRKKAEDTLYGEFLDFYEQWKRRAEKDPEWARENPVSVSVSRTETGDFRILMLPSIA